MSILYMDNFSFYGTGKEARVEMLKGTPWLNHPGVPFGNDTSTSFTVVADPGGGSDRCIRVIDGSGDTDSANWRIAVPTPGDKVGVALRARLAGMPTTEAHGAIIMAWKTSGNDHRYFLRMTPTGQLKFCRTTTAGQAIWNGDYGGITTLATSAPLIITSNTWQHVEGVVDFTTGAYEIRVEGVSVLSGVDGAPVGGTCGIVSFVADYDGTAAGSPAFYIKDLILWDDNGTQNNNFIGPVKVYALPVDSDISSGWTRSSGLVDFSLLDESTPNDAGFVSASDALPAACIMGFANLPADVVSVRALQTVVRTVKTDGGDGKLQVGLISGASEDTGADAAASTSHRYHWDVSELDPAIAAAWTPVTTNNATLKLNRTL